MKKSYQYILLDWDGNLAKTLDVWLDSLDTVLRRHGVTRSRTELARSLGAFSKFADEDWRLDFEAIWPEINELARKQLPHVELYPDALLVIRELYNRGKNLALITTSPHENVSMLLEKYDLMHYFETIVAAEDVTHYKPHPEPLEKGLSQMGGTKKEHSIMIGDSDKDAAAAVNFGCDSILFYPPEHHDIYNLDELKAHKPTYIVQDFKEILDIIN